MKIYEGGLASLIVDESVAVLPVISLATQMSSALNEMHRYGIVHCDIKSQNILYELVNEAYQICITDFGVSQVKLSKEKVQKRHNMQIPAMSVPFAAPEILAGIEGLKHAPKYMVEVDLAESRGPPQEPEIDESRDVYAMAIVMWELVARQRAWHGTKIMEIHDLVCIKAERPSCAMNDKFVQAMESAGKLNFDGYISVLQQCWHQNPARRMMAAEAHVRLMKL